MIDTHPRPYKDCPPPPYRAPPVDQEPLSILPQSHIPTANALKNKFDWLIADELVSIGRQATPISEHLVQTVVGHVEMTQSDQCYSHRVPLRFVFGSNHSLSHFLQELEAVQVPNYVVNKTSNCYYLSPMLLQQGPAHLSLYHINEDEGRSKTPPPYSVQPRSRVHRRSLSSGYPRGHAPKGHAPSSQPESVGVSAEGSRESLAGQSVGGYEASQSCSVSSVVSVEECGRELQDEGSWLILRPLPDLVEVCLQVGRHTVLSLLLLILPLIYIACVVMLILPLIPYIHSLCCHANTTLIPYIHSLCCHANTTPYTLYT